MLAQNELGFGGAVAVKHDKGTTEPGILWKLKNLPNVWRGKWRWALAEALGIPTMYSQLFAKARRADGTTVNYGLVGTRVVTDVYVNLLVDDLQGSQAAHSTMKYHASGTGVAAEAAGDTTLGTEVETTRATGTQTEGATANIYKTVGTITYTATRAITEHGVFSALTVGTLLDRTVFSAINVENTDQIEFTYQLTASSGG